MDATTARRVVVRPAIRTIRGRLDWASEQFRRIPVRWRIATVVILNLAFITLLMLLIGSGARAIRSAWDDLQEARRIDRLLASIENDAGRLQTLIHRYFALPNEAVLGEIEQRRKALLAKLAIEQEIDLALQNPARSVTSVTERFMLGFDELRSVRETISSIYENEIRKPASELSQLYAVVETAMADRSALVAPSLGKSREAFSIFLVAINDYYLTQSVQAQREASRSIEVIQATAPVMVDLAQTEFQRAALQALADRTTALQGRLRPHDPGARHAEPSAAGGDRRQPGGHGDGHPGGGRAGARQGGCGTGAARPDAAHRLRAGGRHRRHLPRHRRRHLDADRPVDPRAAG